MAGFDYEVGDYFVEDADGFGEGVGVVAEGVEEVFYFGGEI
jgi:hypothetical protein